MNRLELEKQQNRLLYRELFFKADEDIKKKLNALKQPSFCKKCRVCCELRYTNLSPEQIFKLSKEDAVSHNYLKLFIPYGADKNFDYESNNTLDIENNHVQAKIVNENYVNLIISKSDEPVYFYKCKHITTNRECSVHRNKNFLCTNFPHSVTTILDVHCGYREWQKLALSSLKFDISRDIFVKIKEVKDFKDNFNCKMCAKCCRLASSEFSFEQLSEKAKNGDKFASQFISVFIPYENIQEAREVFPEFVDLIKSKFSSSEEVYFYHCPHVTDDNKCPRYDTRPDICREFPDNPLAIFPPGCGFYEWKEDVEVGAMLLHALADICDFNIKKIEKLLDMEKG